MVQAKAPAHLLEGSWPTEALLAQIAVARHSGHMALNRQAVVMARLGVPIERSVLADLDGPDQIWRSGALIAPVVGPVVDRMAVLLKSGSSRLHVDETTAAVLDRVLDPGRAAGRKPVISGPCCAMVSHCGAIGSSPMANGWNGWNGPAPPGVVFHCHPGRKGEHADQILTGFDGIIQGEEGQQTVRV